MIESLAGKAITVLFDSRVIVALIGATLSIVMHELFHVITHWGEIENISIFPDHNAIVTIFFAPKSDFDLLIEELVAYMITMVTLMLTIMLVSDIHESRDRRSVQQIIFGKSTGSHDSRASNKRSRDQMRELLGIRASKRETPTKVKKK